MKQTKTTILSTPGFTSIAVIKDTLGEATKGKGEFIQLLIPGYSPSLSGSWGRNLKHPQPEQRNKSTHSAYLPMLSSLTQFRATPMQWCCPHPSQVLLPTSHQGTLSQTCTQASWICALPH